MWTIIGGLLLRGLVEFRLASDDRRLGTHLPFIVAYLFD